MEHIIWFDLEITDGIIDLDIKQKAVNIFNSWKKKGVWLMGEQKISQWRPRNNVALVTNLKDLHELCLGIDEKEMSELKITNDMILFETNSVLRLSFEK